MQIGEIVFSARTCDPDSQDGFLPIQELAQDRFLALELGKRSAKSAGPWEMELKKADLAGGEIKPGAGLRIDRPQTLEKADCLPSGLKVSPAFLERVLREWVKFAGTAFLSARSFGGSFRNSASVSRLSSLEGAENLDGKLGSADESASRRYLPPSGKVLGGEELSNMLEASLDGWLTTGRFNERFEEQLAAFLGVKRVLTVNSGSSANLLALTALTDSTLGERRLTPGDEVLTVAAGFPTTVAPILQNQLVPVFIDIEPGAYNLDPAQLEEALTPKTKAVFAAHTLGNPFDLEAVQKFAQKHQLWLIEDNCDALGSQYGGKYTGSFGEISTFSFYPAHHITMGEGGALATQDGKLAKIIASYRDWGRDCWCAPGVDNTCGCRFSRQFGKLPAGYDHKYVYSRLGYNLKLTDWQAAIGLAQLGKLPLFMEQRKANFQRLMQGFKKLEKYFLLPLAGKKADPCWFGFILTVREGSGIDKNALVEHLEEKGIGTRSLFAGNILRQPVFTENQYPLRIRNSGSLISNRLSEEHFALLPHSEQAMAGSFWLGLWPGLGEEDIARMVGAFEDYCGGK